MSPATDDAVPVLSEDLWARIFGTLQTLLFKDVGCTDEDRSAEVNAERALHHQLPSICSLFCSVFQRNTQLFANLYLREDVPYAAAASLLSWVHRHRGYVKTLVSPCGSPIAEIALGALHDVPSRLTTAMVDNVSQGMVSALGAFTSLTVCDLDAQQARLDLSSLHTLHLLTDLQLWDGTFTVGGLSTNLSYLFLEDARLTCAEDLAAAGALQVMELHGSVLDGVHATGLSACTRLRELSCFGSHIGATNATQRIDISLGAVTILPQTFPALHHMTLLELDLASQITGRFSFSFLSTLTALQGLCLDCGVTDPGVEVVLCDSLTCLRKLQHLQVKLIPHNVTSRLVSNMRWHLMKELRLIMLSADEFQFDLNILGMTELECLQELIFGYDKPFDRDTAGYLASLMYHMALLRPCVSCRVPCHEGYAYPTDQLANFKAML